MKTRYIIVVGILLSFALGYVIGHSLDLQKLADYCKSLGEFSTLLFGVIGMWLSLLYRDEIITNLWSTKVGTAHVRAARLVIVSHDRCRVLSRGFCLSAIVLLMVYAIIFVGIDMIRGAITWFCPCPLILNIGRYVLSFVVAWCSVTQLYVLLSCISPMLAIMKELKGVKRDAERIIALESVCVENGEL